MLGEQFQPRCLLLRQSRYGTKCIRRNWRRQRRWYWGVFRLSFVSLRLLAPSGSVLPELLNNFTRDIVFRIVHRRMMLSFEEASGVFQQLQCRPEQPFVLGSSLGFVFCTLKIQFIHRSQLMRTRKNFLRTLEETNVTHESSLVPLVVCKFCFEQSVSISGWLVFFKPGPH